MKRISVGEKAPAALQAMLGLEKYIRSSGLDRKLCELIKIRASQLNGCAYCLDMHTEEALDLGESPRRIFALSAWEESPLFTDDERIALQLTEEVTLIADGGVDDCTYEDALNAFGEENLAHIIMQIVIINSWNRIAVSGKQIFKGKDDK